MPFDALLRSLRLLRCLYRTLRRTAADFPRTHHVLHSIMRSSHSAIVVIDGRSIILEWSSKAECMFGWTASEVVGKPLHEFIVPPQHRAAHIVA